MATRAALAQTCVSTCQNALESLQNCLANVGESGQSSQNCLANVGKSGESTNKRNCVVRECHKYASKQVLSKVHTSTHDKVCHFMHKKTDWICINWPSLHPPNLPDLQNLTNCDKLKYLIFNILAKLDSR